MKKKTQLYIQHFLNIYSNSTMIYPYIAHILFWKLIFSLSQSLLPALSSPIHNCSPSLAYMKTKQYHSLSLPRYLQKAHTLLKIFQAFSLL